MESFPCAAPVNNQAMLFGSGVGTLPIEFPKGVAVRLPKGNQVVLNLHLYNTSPKPLSGESGTRIRVVAPAQVEVEAEAMLMGTPAISLDPEKTTTVTGNCTQVADTTIFSVTPHMHKLGTHFKVVAESGQQGDQVLYDEDYSFDSQVVRMLDQQVPMLKGEKVRVECTYENTTTKTVTFGESTYDEMCFAGVYRYPATPGGFFVCIS